VSPSFRNWALYLKSKANTLGIYDCSTFCLILVQFGLSNSEKAWREICNFYTGHGAMGKKVRPIIRNRKSINHCYDRGQHEVIMQRPSDYAFDANSGQREAFRSSFRPLTPISRNASSPDLVDGFQWKLAQVFDLWLDSADSGVTRVGVIRGDNWWVSPYFFLGKIWRPFWSSPLKVMTSFICRLLTTPTFPRRLSGVLSKFSHINFRSGITLSPCTPMKDVTRGGPPPPP